MPVASEELRTDASAMRNLTVHLDDLVVACHKDGELQSVALKFQMEHAAAAATYQTDADAMAGRDRGNAHLRATLIRMLDLVVFVASTVLRRAVDSSRTTSISGCSPPSPTADEQPLMVPLTPVSGSPSSVHLAAFPGSVDDLAQASEGAKVRDANAMHHAVRVASFIFVVSDELRKPLQDHGLRIGLLDVCKKAICLPRLIELQFFAEGFKTDHMAVLSNFTFENTDVCAAVGADDALLQAVLCATRVDEENPGMVEWAKFCVRNVCEKSVLARERIKSLKPLSNTF